MFTFIAHVRKPSAAVALGVAPSNATVINQSRLATLQLFFVAVITVLFPIFLHVEIESVSSVVKLTVDIAVLNSSSMQTPPTFPCLLVRFQNISFSYHN